MGQVEYQFKMGPLPLTISFTKAILIIEQFIFYHSKMMLCETIIYFTLTSEFIVVLYHAYFLELIATD